MRCFYFLIAIVFLLGCDKDIAVIEESVDEITTKTAQKFPSWLSVDHPELGSVTIPSNLYDISSKTLVTFTIKGNSKNVNWLTYYNFQERREYNWEGSFVINPSTDHLRIVFVDGPIDVNIPNTNIYHRYDFQWDHTSYPETFVRQAITKSVELMGKSNAEELVPIFNSSQIHLFSSYESDASIGEADGNNMIRLNVFDSYYPLVKYACVIIHEFAHVYNNRNPHINTKLRELFANANWNNPNGYYATAFNEMFACAVSYYTYSDPLSGTGIGSEPYYTEQILPYLKSIFE